MRPPGAEAAEEGLQSSPSGEPLPYSEMTLCTSSAFLGQSVGHLQCSADSACKAAVLAGMYGNEGACRCAAEELAQQQELLRTQEPARTAADRGAPAPAPAGAADGARCSFSNLEGSGNVNTSTGCVWTQFDASDLMYTDVGSLLPSRVNRPRLVRSCCHERRQPACRCAAQSAGAKGSTPGAPSCGPRVPGAAKGAHLLARGDHLGQAQHARVQCRLNAAVGLDRAQLGPGHQFALRANQVWCWVNSGN